MLALICCVFFELPGLASLLYDEFICHLLQRQWQTLLHSMHQKVESERKGIKLLKQRYIWHFLSLQVKHCSSGVSIILKSALLPKR